jgi:hypothetical protein
MSASPEHLNKTAAPGTSPRVRQLIADEQLWTVHEVASPQFDRRGGIHLVFESEGVMRRIRSYPANWFDLSDAELYALTDRIRVGD